MQCLPFIAGCLFVTSLSGVVSLLVPVAPAAAAESQAAVVDSPDRVLPVGVARVDVTPEYPVRLSGFASRKEASAGVSQRIWAKALAIGSDDQQPVVLITLDNLGIRTPMVEEVARRLHERAGIVRERLVVTFTHTHCAPKVAGAADNIFAMPIPADDAARIEQYTGELTDALERVALDALADRRPSQLSWSVGQVGFAKNRRTAGGPVDHDLPVLFVKDLDGTVRAVHTTYACHCVTLSHNLISGDWAGYAQEAIERKFPGAIALVSIGCGSDSNPDSGVTGDRVDIATAQGMQIADEVERLLAGAQQPVHGPLRATLATIGLALEALPTREQWLAIEAAGGPQGYNATTQLARLDRGEELSQVLDYPVQSLCFGDSLCMVFLAGEVCVDYSLRLKRELARERLWLCGYSNDFGAYIPSERLLEEGGYGAGAEVPYFALPAKLRPGLERQIVEEVKRQLPPQFQLAGGTQGVPALDAAAALARLETHPDLRVELVAAEPLIADPVAIDFGADGSLWVALMQDYAHAVDDVFTPTGEVRWLRDTTGDGQFDQALPFLSGLRFPTDVKVWRQGLLVCDAPDILYAEDTDGDGVADVRRVLFTGFATHNAQARVNGLRWGLDNWMYASCGLFGGQVTNWKGETFELTDRDFRFHPDTGVMEAVTGRSQQGRVRDDWGNWFGCDNGTLVRHYPVADEIARRNPLVIPPPVSIYVPAGPRAGQLFPAGDLLLFQLSGAAGLATSACGLDIYRDELLGAAYAGNAFSCEPVNQLVYRQQLTREGAVFRGRRAAEEQEREFLRSPDRWFRPVQVRTGPDGALWVVDMARYVIEHPNFIPPETKAELNLFAGQGLGRIYRVLPRDASVSPVQSLAGCGPEQLAHAIDTANGTIRDWIQQMVVCEPARAATAVLEAVVRSGRYPAGRLSALCTLDGVDALTPELLAVALRDPHPAMRLHAVRLSQRWLESHTELLESVLGLADDPAYEVRLQVAGSLGFSHDPRVAEALIKLVVGAPDAYMIWTALCSIQASNREALLVRVLQAETDALPEPWVAGCIDTLAGSGDERAIRNVLQRIVQAAHEADTAAQPRQLRRVVRLLSGLVRRGLQLETLLDATAGQHLQACLQQARRQLAAGDGGLPQKKLALELLASPGQQWKSLGGFREPGDADLLVGLVASQQAVELQVAAIEAIARRGVDEEFSRLLAQVREVTPAVKQPIIDSALSRPRWSEQLLVALETRTLLPADMDAAQRQRLSTAVEPAAQPRVEQALAMGTASRAAVVQQWQPVLELAGDTERGGMVFARRCQACHVVDGKGHEVGPNLAALTTRSAPYLLSAIIDPNREVDGRYQNYVAVTRDGRSVAGLLAGETATSVTLREQGGKEHVLLRDDLEQLKGTGKTVMPEGLEADLSQQDMADLIAYVQELKA
jgi:putative membrane-bound dehydrogenase-like protein